MLILLATPFFNGVKSTRYQPVCNSERLIVLVQSRSIASSQPAGTSGSTTSSGATLRVISPLASTRIYAVSTLSTLLAYFSHAKLIIPAVNSVSNVRPSAKSNDLSTVANAGQEVANVHSTVIFLSASAFTRKFLLKLLNA